MAPPLPPNVRPYRSRAVVGFPVGKDTSQRHQSTNVTASARATRTLHEFEVTRLARETTTNDLSLRRRDLVNLKGIELVLECRNLSTKPMQLRCALIAPKFARVVDTVDFFRGVGNARGQSFNTTLTSMSFNTRTINRDLYDVVWQSQFLYSEMDSAALDSWRSGNRTSYNSISKYIKVNRQIRFDGALSTDCTTPIYLVYWFDGFQTAASATAEPAAMQISHKTILYWNEAK